MRCSRRNGRPPRSCGLVPPRTRSAAARPSTPLHLSRARTSVAHERCVRHRAAAGARIPLEALGVRHPRDRRDRRACRSARLEHPRLVQRAVGHDHDDLGRVRRRGLPAADRADDHDGVRVVLDPSLWVSGRRRAVARGVGRLRSVGRVERDPAGEPRHADDAADVHHLHRGRDVRRRDRRLRGGEDLLHADRRVRLPVPVPHRRRLVRHQVRLRARAPVGDRDRADRRRAARSGG